MVERGRSEGLDEASARQLRSSQASQDRAGVHRVGRDHARVRALESRTVEAVEICLDEANVPRTGKTTGRKDRQDLHACCLDAQGQEEVTESLVHPSIWRILVSAQDLGCRHNGEDPSRREELDRSRRVPLGAPASNAVVPLLIHIVEADADVK